MKQTAYVINLDKRPDRWAAVQRVWEPYFRLVRLPAIDCQNGAEGCKRSHHELAVQILNTKPIAIVIEDDAIPSAWFQRIGLDCIEESKRNIDEWDVIACGPYLDLSSLGLPKAELKQTMSSLFLATSYFHQTHFMLYNRRSVPLLEASLRNRLPLDMFLGANARHAWVPIRLLATQAPGPSDIPQHPKANLALLYTLSEQILADRVPASEVLDWCERKAVNKEKV